ncbi:MAG: aryl-sulfate sulfotransferase, partial [Gammaproteobacteria bacterium]
GSLYLLDNGHLIRGAREPEVPAFWGGGQGGRIQELTWDGEIVWDYLLASEEHLLHHDFEVLPNGNVLAIAWEKRTPEEARRAGRKPDRTPEGGLWPDKIVELEPLPPNDARIVWEWHMWDHIVQNHDASLRGYGEPSAHPELVDPRRAWRSSAPTCFTPTRFTTMPISTRSC